MLKKSVNSPIFPLPRKTTQIIDISCTQRYSVAKITTMLIPFHKPHITEKEINSVVETLKSGWLTIGPKTKEFEKNFSKYLNIKHSVFLNSATAALHLALSAIEIKPGDEVIIPTNTYVSTAEVITYFDAIPILCDIEENTYNIDITKIEPLITNRTKAIIPVHFAGQPCDMDEIQTIAKKYSLKIIEDAAHALPSLYKGKKIGTLSDITCFSFYSSKTLCTAEGGMAVTNNQKYAKKIETQRIHGINIDVWDRYTKHKNWYYEVIDSGFKYNSSDLNASLGLVQLEKLEWMQTKRFKIAKKYSSSFSKTKIEIPTLKSDRNSSWHMYVIKVNNRDELIEELTNEGIGCTVHYLPIHKQPYYKKRYSYKEKNYPVANKAFEKYLSLPIYPSLTDRHVEYIIDKVIQFAK